MSRLLLSLALMLVLAPMRPTMAQPTDSMAADSTAITDSLQVALQQFERAEPPTDADTAAVRQLAASVQEKGKSLLGSAPSEAREYFRQALQAGRRLPDSLGIARSLLNIGVTYEIQSRFDEALERYRHVLQISRTLGLQRGIAKALNNMGNVYNNQGRYEEALDLYQQALQVKRKLGNREDIASTLNDLGTVHVKQGQYREALFRFRESLQIKREIGDQEGAALTLNNIGAIYETQGRLKEARAWHREALTIRRDLGNQRGIAQSLNSIGIIYEKKGRYEEALNHFREALQIRRDLGLQQGVVKALSNIGGVYERQGHHEQALERYQEALQISRDLQIRRDIAQIQHSIGDVYGSQGRHPEALARYREALQIRKTLDDRRGIAETFMGIGRSYLETNDLRAATDRLSNAIRRAEELRLNATSPDARRSLLSTQIDAYQALTTAYVRAERPDSALRTVEQARARLLADRLAGTATGDTSFALPSAVELRGTLGSNEGALLYANADTDEPLAAVAVTRDSVYARELPDSTIRAEIKQAYPTHLDRLRRAEGPLTEALGAEAAASGTDEGPLPSLAEAVRLYRYHLVRSGTDVSVQQDLSRRLRELLIKPVADHVSAAEKLTVVPTGALGYLPFETLQDSAGSYLVEETGVRYAQSLTVRRQLQKRDYAGREKPLLAVGGAAYQPEVEIDGESLVAEARGGTSRVATNEHASTLSQDAGRRMKQGKSPRPTYQQLGYRSWADLPGTEEEVKEISSIMGASSTVITGPEASEDTVRALSGNEQLSEHRYVHFATHGIAVPETPKLSALVLSQVGASDSLAARDGYLTMEEIAGLEMEADVAVLSACQTGLGKVVAGEGVVSLSHAFLRAGANATLVSQWKVLDESTRQFMTSVYERATDESTSFAEAVSETKRAFIAGEHGEKNTDPLRWAPFVYYGRE